MSDSAGLAGTARRVGAALVSVLSQQDPTAVPAAIRRDPGVLALPGFAEAARFHRVEPAVHLALRDFPDVPEALRDELAAAHREQVLRHMAALWNLRALGSLLDHIGCRWACVKGPYLAGYVHQRPDLRSYYDLDVVIDHHYLPQVVAALEGDGGVVLDRNWDLIRDGARAQVSLLLRLGTPLDLHWHLLNRGPVRRAFHLDMEALLQRVRRLDLGATPANVLDDVDALVHLALHATLAGGYRLVWIHDVHAMFTRHPMDHTLLVQRAHRAGAGLCLAVILQRARGTFGTAVPGSLLDSLACPIGWRAVTATVDRLRPVQTGYRRRYMGRTIVRATRATTVDSLREFSRTAVRDVRARVVNGVEGTEPGAGPELGLNPLYLSRGSLHDRDAFFAEVAATTSL